MAGTGARDIKRKIKSVNSTRQITKAMELVSTAKLKVNRRKFDETKPFFEKTFETVHEIFENEKSLKHPLLSARDVKKTLIIVITADRGLCGGYNVNVLRETEHLVSKLGDCQLITIGKKAKDYFTRRNYDIVQSFEGISEKPTKEDSKQISDKLIEMFKAEEVDEVYMVSTKMISTISQVPEHVKILPMSLEKPSAIDEEDGLEAEQINPEDIEITTYAPSPEAVLNMVIPMYINSAILGALIESSCAEQAARRNAMESASDNAKEMIDSLSLSYNQARQAAITQEITEIVGGASALE